MAENQQHEGGLLLGLVDVLMRELLVPPLTLPPTHSVVHLPPVVLSIASDADVCKPGAESYCIIGSVSRFLGLLGSLGGGTIFALWDVTALITPLRVRCVAPGANAIPVRVPAVVQLQAVSGCGGPPEMNEGERSAGFLGGSTFSLHVYDL